ncbi:hypothetical protein QOZ80_8AG0624280 [Eleusine coracana subsp. coracana]|nr:hypothetical protein QOZ80_8AG0624280 [Eleusine coracana subsp. coracana]
MATPVTVSSAPAPASTRPAELNVHESRRQYTPSMWGDFFLTHQPCTPSEIDSMKNKVQALMQKVRLIVLEAATLDDLTQKLDLVDALQQLGLAYRHKKEVDELLRAVYNNKDGVPIDLYVTSLRFYLLRKHRYAVLLMVKRFQATD